MSQMYKSFTVFSHFLGEPSHDTNLSILSTFDTGNMTASGTHTLQAYMDHFIKILFTY